MSKESFFKINIKIVHTVETRLGLFLLAVIAVVGVFGSIFIKPETAPLYVTPVFKYVGRPEIAHGDTSKQQIIVTFDAGSVNVSGDKILEVLKKHNVRGTFFVTGIFANANPEFIRKIASSSGEIFNHTYSHPHLTELSNYEISKQISDVDSLIKNITGKSTRPYFRAPYGDRDERVLDEAYRIGYRHVYWTIDAKDWSIGETNETVSDRVITTLAPGNIYLFHVGDAITGSILDDLLNTVESKGYKAVSLTEGL